MLKIFLVIWFAMIATSFWEAYVEGKHPWDDGKLGWKIRYKKHTLLTAYHFWLFWVTFPALLLLPMILGGFSWELFGIIVSAYGTGLILEDFFWFVVNPVFRLSHFNSRYVKWYPWLKIGKFEIPAAYPVALMISLISWYFLWR